MEDFESGIDLSANKTLNIANVCLGFAYDVQLPDISLSISLYISKPSIA